MSWDNAAVPWSAPAVTWASVTGLGEYVVVGSVSYFEGDDHRWVVEGQRVTLSGPLELAMYSAGLVRPIGLAVDLDPYNTPDAQLPVGGDPGSLRFRIRKPRVLSARRLAEMTSSEAIGYLDTHPLEAPRIDALERVGRNRADVLARIADLTT